MTPENEEAGDTPMSPAPEANQQYPDSVADIEPGCPLHRTIEDRARVDADVLFGLDDPEPPRPLAELTFFRTTELPGQPPTTILSVPPYGGNATHVTHAILWDDNAFKRARVYAVLKRLYRRRLLPPNCHLIGVLSTGIVISMSADDEHRDAYAAAVQKLKWSIPCHVTVSACDGILLRTAEKLDLGSHYADEQAPA